jgi:hypothetical protein
LPGVVHASDESIVHIDVRTNQRRRKMVSSSPGVLSAFSYVRWHAHSHALRERAFESTKKMRAGSRWRKGGAAGPPATPGCGGRARIGRLDGDWQ